MYKQFDIWERPSSCPTESARDHEICLVPWNYRNIFEHMQANPHIYNHYVPYAREIVEKMAQWGDKTLHGVLNQCMGLGIRIETNMIIFLTGLIYVRNTIT